MLLAEALAALNTGPRDGDVAQGEDPSAAIASGLQPRYADVQELGRGAMGVVFRARDERLDRDVALKVLRYPLPDKEIAVRLVQESRALAQLRHPNVVTVYDVALDAPQPFVVMEYVHGQTLRRWLATRPTRRAIARLFVGVIDGLHAAHQAGVLHLDVKPDNILVDDDAQPRLVDFGLATRFARGDTAVDNEPAGRPGGTPAYMSPEHFDGGALDRSADVFSLCVCLWEALTQERPYDESSPERRHDAAAQEILRKPPKGAVSGPLHRALVQGLSADKARRPSLPTLRAALTDIVDRRRAIRLTGALVLTGSLAAGAWAFAASQDPIATDPLQACLALVPAVPSSARLPLSSLGAKAPAASDLAEADAREHLNAQLDAIEQQGAAACHELTAHTIDAAEQRARYVCLRAQALDATTVLTSAASDPAILAAFDAFPSAELCAPWARHIAKSEAIPDTLTASWLEVLDGHARFLASVRMERPNANPLPGLQAKAAATGNAWLDAIIAFDAVVGDPEATLSDGSALRAVDALHRSGDHATEARALGLATMTSAVSPQNYPEETTLDLLERLEQTMAEVQAPELRQRSEQLATVIRATMAFQSGDLQEANRLLDRAYETKMSGAQRSAIATMRAGAAMYLGDPRDAVSALHDLVRYLEHRGSAQRARLVSTLVDLAEAHLILGESAQAREHCTRAATLAQSLELAPLDKAALELMVAMVDLEDGDFDAATQKIDSVAQWLPAPHHADVGLLERQGLVLLATGHNDALVRRLDDSALTQAAFELQVLEIQTLVTFAEALRRLGHPGRAEALIVTHQAWYAEHYPGAQEGASALLTLGWCAFDREQFALAHERFEEALPHLYHPAEAASARFGSAAAARAMGALGLDVALMAVANAELTLSTFPAHEHTLQSARHWREAN